MDFWYWWNVLGILKMQLTSGRSLACTATFFWLRTHTAIRMKKYSTSFVSNGLMGTVLHSTLVARHCRVFPPLRVTKHPAECRRTLAWKVYTGIYKSSMWNYIGTLHLCRKKSTSSSWKRIPRMTNDQAMCTMFITVEHKIIVWKVPNRLTARKKDKFIKIKTTR